MSIAKIHDKLWPNSTAMEKRRRLTRFSIAEISAVDRPAQAHAKAVIMKRDDSPEPKPIDLAKRVIAGEAAGDAGEFYKAIEKRAAKLRRDGETAEQAFARVITEDDKGKALFKALRMSPDSGIHAWSGDTPPPTYDELPAPSTPEAEMDRVKEGSFPGPASAQLDKLARDRMNAEPSLTYARAYNQVLNAPQNRALRDLVRMEEWTKPRWKV